MGLPVDLPPLVVVGPAVRERGHDLPARQREERRLPQERLDRLVGEARQIARVRLTQVAVDGQEVLQAVAARADRRCRCEDGGQDPVEKGGGDLDVVLPGRYRLESVDESNAALVADVVDRDDRDPVGVLEVVGGGEQGEALAVAAAGQRRAWIEVVSGLDAVAHGAVADPIEDGLAATLRQIGLSREHLERRRGEAHGKLELFHGASSGTPPGGRAGGGHPHDRGALDQAPSPLSPNLRADRELAVAEAERLPAGKCRALTLGESDLEAALDQIDDDPGDATIRLASLDRNRRSRSDRRTRRADRDLRRRADTQRARAKAR